MTIYDVSLPISPSMIVWPGDDPVHIQEKGSVEKGDSSTTSRLDFPSHFGTHVDAQRHFIAGGTGVDDLDLDILVGWARVVHVPDADAITADVLEKLNIPLDTMRLLIRTRNSELWARGHTEFDKSYVAITEAGARWLVERGVRLVGVDYLSVAPFNATRPTHQVLLEAGVIALEGLNLSEVPPGMYQLVCLPLKIVNGDGAPARTILISNIEAGAKSGE